MKLNFKYTLAVMLIAFSAIMLKAQTSCQAAFMWGVNPNGVYTFYDSSFVGSGYNIVSWNWNFGNGNTSTNQNPTQVFNAPGTYNVCLKITAQLQNAAIYCTDSVCQTIVFTCPANITGSFAFSTQQLTAAFTPNFTSNYPPLSYLWTFGDGDSSTAANPQHTYAAAGTYTTCVTVTSSNGCSKTECKQVTVTSGGCNLQAYFSYTQPNKNTIVVSPQTVGGTPTANIHVWRLGGITLGTTTGNGGSYTYSIPNTLTDGTYQLCLKVEQPNTFCRDSFCKTITVCRANGEFTYTVLTNDTIKFAPVATSTYGHKWYANGSLFSTNADPKIKFPNGFNGLNICHIVTSNTLTACVDTFCRVLQANPCNANAGFQFMIDSNGTTAFFPATTANGWDHIWTFGPGTGSTAISPTVNLAPGTYNVCHIIIQSGNTTCRDSFCQTITIPGNTPCNLSATISKGTNPNSVILEAAAPNSVGPFTYLWSSGQTTKAINVGNNYGTYCVTITQTSTGCTASTCYVYQPATPLDTVCGVTFNDANGNGVLDAGEVPFSTRIFITGNGVQLTVWSDSITGEWHAYLPAGTYNICAYGASNTTGGWVPTLPINNNTGINNGSACYSVTLSANQNLCGLNFGFQNTRVTICGYVFVDVNGNTTKDAGEPGIQGQAVKIGNLTAYSNYDGYYVFNLPAGTYTITYSPTAPYTGYTANPSTHTVTATTVGQQYCGNNFGVVVPPSQCDVAVDVTPLSTVTPGFTAIYNIKVFNLNGVTTGGLLTFNFEPGLTFQSANPTQASFNNTNAAVTWNVSNLAPGTYKTYTVRLNVPANTQLGLPVFSFAEFTTNGSCTESNLTNNIDTTHQTVVGSYDPNDKHVSPEGKIANVGQELVYTIRFQNTGTAPAVNVVILDTLSNFLDWTTLEFKASSHSCNIQQEGAYLSFIFSNIMLPDSFSNEAESHGFVSYKIKAQNNLNAGTQIKNTAAIYFDFNEPVVTNTTVNTIDVELNVNEVIASNINVSVSPNPFKNFTNIAVKGADESAIEIVVIDVAGRKVLNQISATNLIQLEAGNLTRGIYVYELKQHNQTIAIGKLIAE